MISTFAFVFFEEEVTMFSLLLCYYADKNGIYFVTSLFLQNVSS